MLQRVAFRNFKGFRHVDVGLERLTAIVGPNGSGKTTILEGLHYLSRLGTLKPEGLFRGKHSPSLIRSRGAKEGMAFSCASPTGEFRCRYDSKQALLLTGLESLDLNGERRFWTEERDGGQSAEEWTVSVGHPPVLASISNARLLRLNATRLAAPSFSSDARPHMDREGSGLASTLAFMALGQPDAFLAIQSRLRKVIPSVERIRFERLATTMMVPESIRIDEEYIKRQTRREFIRESILFDFQGAPDLPAHMASEGTLIVLGLLTELMSPLRPQLLLLDDLDHGLHPKAQQEVVGLLRKILEENPEMQIVMTTHSPYLLDNLRPEEVRLTTLNDDGSAACAPLIAHPDFDRWKGEMSPGEMWSLFGEEWVASQPVKG